VGISVPYPEVSGEAGPAGLGDLEAFRAKFYDCLSTRADALFELTDAVLCSPGPVTTLVDLSLCPEHRRGHGALYDGLSCGAIEIKGLQFAIAALKLPRGTDGRITLGIDVSPWLRPDAPSSADRLFCHVHGRGKNQAQMIPGWPCSVVCRGGTGSHLVDGGTGRGAPEPDDDDTTVAATQVREVVGRLRAAGHVKDGDLDILLVFRLRIRRDLAFLLADLPVQLLGRLRSDRSCSSPPRHRAGPGGRRGTARSSHSPTPAAGRNRR